MTNTVGNVTLFSRAIGNDFEEDANAPNANIRNYQTNDSTEYSKSNSTITTTTGNVAVTSVAIGNNAQIIHH